MLRSFKEDRRLAIDFASSGKSLAYKNFAQESTGLPALQCISHLTGIRFTVFSRVGYLTFIRFFSAISKTKGINLKHFNERESYETFNGWVSRAGNCPHKAICGILPNKTCEKLQDMGEQSAIEWFH